MALPHDDPPAPTPTPPEGDANLDPLTHEPGAHPVGVGVGAAGVGMVGALIGAVAGPVGLLVGTVVGALTGAVVGKEAAEAVHPTEPAALARGEAERTAGVADHEVSDAPVSVPTMDAGEAYFGGGGTGAITPVPPSPESGSVAAAPAPPAAVPAANHPRLRKFVLPIARVTADEAPPVTPPLPPPLEITAHLAYPEDQVRDAAYFRYLERERTGQPGGELDDWTAAEREVLGG